MLDLQPSEANIRQARARSPLLRRPGQKGPARHPHPVGSAHYPVARSCVRLSTDPHLAAVSVRERNGISAISHLVTARTLVTSQFRFVARRGAFYYLSLEPDSLPFCVRIFLLSK